MKRKILWMLVSWLIVAALVLASCGPALPGEQEEEEPVGEQEEEEEEEEPVGEQEEEEEEEPVGEQEEEEEEEPAAGAPQYGGSLTFLAETFAFPPLSPDVNDNQGRVNNYALAMQETALIGDVETYGGMGTGEFNFWFIGAIPDKYVMGNLLESWEVSLEKIVWHVKPGIYWAPNEKQRAWMEARELTAEDIVASLIYYREAPQAVAFKRMSGDIYATGRYTLEIEYTKFDLTMLSIIGLSSWARICPPEMREVGADKWENQVGTGPFIFKKYVVGSYMSFDRNPNYHRTMTINGVEYQMPFIDELVLAIIPDETSMIAALRTGAGDIMQGVFAVHWETLDQTAPDLISVRYPITFGSTTSFKVTEPPFDNRDVRRAMMVGTDMATFQLLRRAGALKIPLHWFPLAEGLPSYTPLEELPAETRLLYDYNPELAKQMLEDALGPPGPDGSFFKTELYTMSDPERLDDAALLKDQWAKIGVELEIKAYESPVLSAYANAGTYTGSIRQGHGGGNPLVDMVNKWKTGAASNLSGWSDSYYDELMDKMVAELDAEKRDLIIKEAAVYLINEAIVVPQAVKVQGAFFWPWVHNHYGEYRLINDDTWTLPMAYAWLDQDMKATMGY